LDVWSSVLYPILCVCVCVCVCVCGNGASFTPPPPTHTHTHIHTLTQTHTHPHSPTPFAHFCFLFSLSLSRSRSSQAAAARKNRRAGLLAAAGSVCLNCGAVDNGDEYRTRPYDTAHLCAKCGDHWRVWGRDREARYSGDGKRRRVDLPTVTAEDIHSALAVLSTKGDDGARDSYRAETIRADAAHAAVAELDAVCIAELSRQLQQERELHVVTQAEREANAPVARAAAAATNASVGIGAGLAEARRSDDAPPKPKSGRGGKGIWSDNEIQLVCVNKTIHTPLLCIDLTISPRVASFRIPPLRQCCLQSLHFTSRHLHAREHTHTHKHTHTHTHTHTHSNVTPLILTRPAFASFFFITKVCRPSQARQRFFVDLQRVFRASWTQDPDPNSKLFLQLQGQRWLAQVPSQRLLIRAEMACTGTFPTAPDSSFILPFFIHQVH
jgi:hypothetical protein